jgi:MerR family transcriptional regulator, redox-sensitive transcriptional activator SoxR
MWPTTLRGRVRVPVVDVVTEGSMVVVTVLHRKTSRMVEVKRLTIGQVAERAGVATSALRFYEEHGLIRADRNEAGHRRYHADVLRRVSFIRTAQRVGLTLGEIADALASLPDGRTPTARDWDRLATSWRPRLDARIDLLTRMRDQLDECIGCGCLSLATCGLWNPDDAAAELGVGPRYLLSDDRPPGVGTG